jgi:hypothetical protein
VTAVRKNIALVVLAIVAALVLVTAAAVALWDAGGDGPRSTRTQTL